MTAHEHSNLPLRDYDHLPLAAVGQRIRSLTAQQLGQPARPKADRQSP